MDIYITDIDSVKNSNSFMHNYKTVSFITLKNPPTVEQGWWADKW